MAHAKDSPDLLLCGDPHEDALTWFVRLNSGDATDAERIRHEAWLAADTVNRREYAKLGGIWSDLGRIPDPRASSAISAVPRGMSRRMVLSGGIAAGMAAGYVGIAGLPDFLFNDYYTGTGEIRRITLEDGTAVDMDADTAIAMRFDDRSRTLLLRRGRAFFDVGEDGRPFEVEAAGGRVTALGTRFSVHLWDDAATVAVAESAVILHAAGGDETRLDAGYRMSFGKDGLGAPEPFDNDMETAWMRGKLIFEDRPLRQVLADVNRYRSGTIRVTDDKLMEMRVSGIFDISNPDGVLDAIENTLPVRSTHLTRYLVVLRPA